MPINPTPITLSALSSAKELAGSPTYLDKMRGRRMQTRELEMNERESAAKTSLYNEQARAAQSATAADAGLSELQRNAPQMPPMPAGASREDMMQIIKDFQIQTATYYTNNGRPDIAKQVAPTITAIGTHAGTDINLDKEEQKATIEGKRAKTESDKSQTALNKSLIKVDVAKVAKESVVWANASLSQQDPGKQGWAAYWTKNWSTDQLAEKTLTLAAILDEILRDYAARTGGMQMPREEAQKEALDRFWAREQGSGGSQPSPTGTSQRRTIDATGQ